MVFAIFSIPHKNTFVELLVEGLPDGLVQRFVWSSLAKTKCSFVILYILGIISTIFSIVSMENCLIVLL